MMTKAKFRNFSQVPDAMETLYPVFTDYTSDRKPCTQFLQTTPVIIMVCFSDMQKVQCLQCIKLSLVAEEDHILCSMHLSSFV